MARTATRECSQKILMTVGITNWVLKNRRIVFIKLTSSRVGSYILLFVKQLI